MTESHSESDPSLIGPILELLASAGYGDANNAHLSDFQKLFRGLSWCISSANTSHHLHTIETVDDIEESLQLMGCPHALQAAQIEDLNYACIYPVVQWIVSLVKTQQHDSNDEALERHEAEFLSDCNSNRLRLQSEITKLEEDLTNNCDKDPHDYLDCSIFDLSKKLKSAKKELSSKLRELVSLKRQLDELPIEAEIVQYECRLSELNVHMQDRHRQTCKFYDTYNALLEIKDLMLKETSLLNSVDSQFGDAIGNPDGRAKLIDSMEAISKGIRQKLEKVQLGIQVEQNTLGTLREQYTAVITNQRHCSVLLKDFQEECRKNERLKKELALRAKQRNQTSPKCYVWNCDEALH